MRRVEIELIPKAILDDLKRYTEDKSKKISEAVNKCTKEAHEDITRDSPVRQKVPKSKVVLVHGVAKANYQPGSYKKGWITVVKTYERGRTQGYVRNKTNYQLTHLLERGHKARDGSFVKPIPHIVDNQNEARRILDEMIKEILEE